MAKKTLMEFEREMLQFQNQTGNPQPLPSLLEGAELLENTELMILLLTAENRRLKEELAETNRILANMSAVLKSVMRAHPEEFDD